MWHIYIKRYLVSECFQFNRIDAPPDPLPCPCPCFLKMTTSVLHSRAALGIRLFHGLSLSEV